MFVSFENRKTKKSSNKFFYFQVSTLFIIFLVWLLYKSDIKKHVWCEVYKECHRQDENQNNKDDTLLKTVIKDVNNIARSKLILLSIPRSGSSFLGEIFNQNQNVYYIYEPLHTQQILTTLKLNKEDKPLDFLSDLFKCKFQQHKDYFQFISNPDLSDQHFRLTSRVFSSPPFCLQPMNDTVSLNEYRENCQRIDPKHAEITCKNTPHVVIKDLIHRFPNHKLLDTIHLLQDEYLKVIFLVRDPRAVIFSMKTIGWLKSSDNISKDFIYTAMKVCKSLKESNDYIRANKQILNDRLIITRYEDIVSEPEDSLSELFWFSGIDLQQSTIDWVIKNTRGQFTSFNLNKSFSLLLKNATFSLNSWRHHLTFEEIITIQETCDNAMLRDYGYTVFNNYYDIKNMTIPTFTSELNIPHALLLS